MALADLESRYCKRCGSQSFCRSACLQWSITSRRSEVAEVDEDLVQAPHPRQSVELAFSEGCEPRCTSKFVSKFLQRENLQYS